MIDPDELTLRPSAYSAQWERALHEGDDALLDELVAKESPGTALLMLESYVNGAYRGSQHPLASPLPEIRSQAQRVLPYIEGIRDRVGWSMRDFDLALLGFVRRSSTLSPVLGAGVSKGAGAPTWPELVRLMLEETLDRGLELTESVPAADNPPEPPIAFQPDGTVRLGGSGTWRFEQRVKEVKRYSADQSSVARNLLEEVRKRGAATDVETLMQGAQTCYDLCGQHLFRLLSGILYDRAKTPSGTHRAIAELAQVQAVPPRGPGPFPGWDAIISYNIDALMNEALAEHAIPHAAWAMKGDKLRGDPDKLAQNSAWHQPVFYLHGYTPRRLFLISEVRFVFSTSQYLATYEGPPSQILKRVYETYLANPVHIALYIGCSFADEAMNNLLRRAFAQYPGRYHYALLQWPRSRQGREPSAEEIAKESKRYLEFGVRPIWFDDFGELPDLIRRLK